MRGRIRVFGPLRAAMPGRALSGADLGGRKPRQLLQLLVAADGQVVVKDAVVEALWPDGGVPARASATVEHYVSVLRRRLGGRMASASSAVRTEPGGYRLDRDIVTTDLGDLMAGPVWSRARDRRRAVEDLLRLSADELFVEEPYTDWAVRARAEVRRVRTDLLVLAGSLALVEGDVPAALLHGNDAIRHEPLLESAYRVVIGAHHVAGDQVRALAAFESCRVRLASDLGVVPAGPTRALADAVREHRSPAQILALVDRAPLVGSG